MTPEMNRKVEDAIVDCVRAHAAAPRIGVGARFIYFIHPVRAVLGDAFELRAIDGALQRLRKRGVLRFDRGRGWLECSK